MSRPEPDFEKCGNCGADAKANCSWDPADGWCCSNCGACDSDERYRTITAKDAA
jgi:hypothetical protein